MFLYNKSMNDIQELGQTIKNARLAKDLRMEDVARMAGISRVTLTNIEKGTGNYSIASLMDVLKLLDLYMKVGGKITDIKHRDRASKVNIEYEKKVNHFVIMCVEQYAASTKKDSNVVYKRIKESGILAELILDYEDLHGMSTEFLNQYIGGLLEE